MENFLKENFKMVYQMERENIIKMELLNISEIGSMEKKKDMESFIIKTEIII
jgi:hypothetical protein